jgi:hypothetical protein
LSQELVGLALSPEEEMVLVGLEGAQARKRVESQRVVHRSISKFADERFQARGIE